VEDQDKLLDYLRRATTSLHETQQRLREAQESRHEPVAIVSMACRLPGEVTDPEGLWQLVLDGRDAVGEVPPERGWDLAEAGSITSRGGFLTDAHRFDAAFFGISPREALAMDPQQRLLVELAWETVERAQIAPTSLRGSRTGVFAGVIAQGYEVRLARSTAEVAGHVLTGCTTSVASGRVSYLLGLQGPAMTVDTACSSSLVAIHLACRALRDGDCDLALAGGATVMSTPSTFTEFSSQGALSEDGRCRAFAAEASGFGLAEGAGVLLLEKLSDARRNGHPVLAVIRGSAVNQDGASNGLTAPSGPAQQRVIRDALEDAGVAALEVDVVEAHGTGTKLGDPIEGRALLETYGRDRPEDTPLWVGSLKSQIGHAQAAAGVAGVIKMVKALQHATVPPTMHVDRPSPLLEWEGTGLRPATASMRWPGTDHPRRAAVSAFGISGTNAHVILEAAEAPDGAGEAAEPATSAPGLVVWPLSARDDVALREQAGRLLAYVQADPGLRPVDIGYSLAATRAVLPARAVALGADGKELAAGLRAIHRGRPARGAVRAAAAPAEPGEVVFVFPGQGSQWTGMARDLMDGSAVFRRRLTECADALAPYLDFSVIDLLRGEPGQPPMARPDVVQPVLFAMMVSLAEQWRAHGVEPAAVVGHSQGEIAAACVAGALDLPAAARLVCLRSRVVVDLAGRGGLVSLALGEAETRARIRRWGDALDIAVVNGPQAVVVAGALPALDELLTECERDGVRARRVQAEYASHSPQVEAVRDKLHEVLHDVRPSPETVPIYSTVTGEVIAGTAMDGGYWYTNLRGTVRFHAATRLLLNDGFRTFIEVSPHPVLISAIEETVEAAAVGGAVVVGTIRRDDGAPERFQRSLAEAWVRGAAVDWTRNRAGADARAVDLPPTAMLGEIYWPAVAADRHAEVVTNGGGAVTADFWSAVGSGDFSRVIETLGVSSDVSAGDLVRALDHWHRRRGTGATIAGWRYRIGWSPWPEPRERAGLDGVWLLVTTGAPLTEAVATMLADAGADVRTTSAVSASAIQQALGGVPPAGVLSLLALDGEDGPAATVALLRTLGELEISAPAWCVTRGAVSIGGSDVLTDPLQAAVWGLGRVAALELPQRWGGLVDLPETLDEHTAARLAGVLAGTTGEDQVAIRATGTYARRLRHLPAGEAVEPAPWRPRGSVLITGGTGALGAHLARDLARHGVQELVLVSRRGPRAPGAERLAAELRELGARVVVAACDLADRDAVQELVAGRAREGRPIRSVVHAAGVVTEVPLTEATPAHVADAMAAKALGGRWLHELFGPADLDAFVVFTSGAGVWGAGGQGPYAAANAVLDALVLHRRARGLPATAVAWGLWDGEGMAAGPVGARLRRRGMRPMAPGDAVAALGDAVVRDIGSVVVADIAWPTFVTGFVSARESHLLDEIDEAAEAVGALAAVPAVRNPDRRADAGWAARLRQLPRGARRDAAHELVVEQAAAVLQLPTGQSMAGGRAFRDAGFDSLTAVELRNRLVAATGLALPVTAVFDHPTPSALAAHLLGVALGEDGDAGPGGEPEQVGGEAGPGDESANRAGPSSPARDEPIAVVGMSCRFPGGADDPEALWRLVATGTDAIGPFPADRGWDLGVDGEGFRHEGGFVTGAGDFDAEFFGLSPREAVMTDPQQRLVLETAWEAVERAGIDPRSLRESRTAVVVGIVSQDYAELLRDTREAKGYRITGGSAAVVSGRVAYLLGLRGQALTVDTACSSSLVAIHLACQALRRGEATLALAGGATVMATPTPFVEFTRQQGLSSDGRCHAFAASADGTGWGEGAGMLLLQRLCDAEAQGREVLAVIRGSALNQDGASNGMTAPSGASQQDVIRDALADAGLSAGDVDAVEAHGTATVLGDPIEAGALLQTYGRDRGDRPLWLGSLKSNIGHTQGAAGVGGVIKMVQALRHESLPPTLHVDAPTPHVDWSSGGIRLLTGSVPWRSGDRPRRAAVSAFGISGTNAHLILEEGPPPAPVAEHRTEAPDRSTAPTFLLMPLSGHVPAALAAHADRLARHLATTPGPALADVARALGTTRPHLSRRAVVLATDREAALQDLGRVAAGERSVTVVTGSARDRPKIAVLLPGQGSQRLGLGRGLYAVSTRYAGAFELACASLDPYLPVPLAQVLFAEPGSPHAELLDRTDYTQAALFAVEVALYRLLETVGVPADVLVGHSVGELAAVHLAGALSLADAARLVAARGRLMQALPERGAMVAVEASEDEMTDTLAGHPAEIALAAVNGPTSVVLSGDERRVLAAAAEWRARGRRTKRLSVARAFHSPHMDEVLAELGSVASGLTWSPTAIPVLSNVTGEPLTADDLGSPDYWARQARQPVRFGDDVRRLVKDGVTLTVELGSEGALSTVVRQIVEAEEAAGGPATTVVPLLRSPRPEPEAFARALAELYVHGAVLDWDATLAELGHRPRPGTVALPTTAFQRKRYWLDTRSSRPQPAPAGRAPGDLGHPVLTAAVPLADTDGWVFTGALSRAGHPWLADHAVEGTAVVPGLALLELVLRAGRQVGLPRVDDLTFEAPILLPAEGSVAVQVLVGAPDPRTGRPVTVHSRRPGAPWTRNAAGRLIPGEAPQVAPDLAAWPPPGAEAVPVDRVYERLAGRGYTFGPAFRSLRAAWQRDGTWFTEVRLPAEHQGAAGGYEIHPALLDSAGHVRLEAFADAGDGDGGKVPILFSVQGVQAHGPTSATLRARLLPRFADTMTMTLADSSGRVVAHVDGLTVRPIAADLLRGTAGASPSLLRTRWTPVPVPAAPGQRRVVVVAAVDGPAGVYPPLDAQRMAADPPGTVLLYAGPAAGAPAEAVRVVTRRVLHALQRLADEPLPERTRVVVVTKGAVAAGPAERIGDVAQAAVWGLVRCAQAEHPGRFVLADVDTDPASHRLLSTVARIGAPHLAVRAGQVLVPELVAAGPADRTGTPIEAGGTVVVTGAAGALGRQVARHAVRHWKAGHVLLLSRRGDTPQSRRLVSELTELGASADVRACDVGDLASLTAALHSVPPDRPVAAVVHAAGVLEDRLLADMTGEQLDRVLRPKVDGALNLLTLLPDGHRIPIVLFSSAAATLGNVGQGAYAAANAALDAVAQQYRHLGVPIRSTAWGPWEDGDGMAGRLDDDARGRLRRQGWSPLSTPDGLALLDSALTTDAAVLLAGHVDTASLPSAGSAPPTAAAPRSGPAPAATLGERIGGLDAGLRPQAVLDVVLRYVAEVLGHADASSLDARQSFLDLGFNSLLAVELRNELTEATGLRLPATLVFEFPTPAVLAAHLLSELTPAAPPRPAPPPSARKPLLFLEPIS
jgi:acyl transferase domain-containing protein/acyl carrier protein